jgi:hypothetical protein
MGHEMSKAVDIHRGDVSIAMFVKSGVEIATLDRLRPLPPKTLKPYQDRTPLSRAAPSRIWSKRSIEQNQALLETVLYPFEQGCAKPKTPGPIIFEQKYIVEDRTVS